MKRRATCTLLACIISAPFCSAQEAPISLDATADFSIIQTGSIMEVESDVSSEGEMVQQRYASGKVNVERWVAENEQGDLVNHGTYVRYNEQGHVIVSGRYKMGSRVGDWSKQLSSEESKKLTGSALIGFKPPFISKATFVDGQLSGDWTCSDSTGKLVFVWTFEDGKRNGTSTTFNAKSEVVRSITYQDDLANGPAKVALKADQPAQDIQFEKGRMLRRIEQHYPVAKKAKKRLKSQDWYLVPTPFNLADSSWELNQVRYQKFDKDDMIRHGRAITYFESGQRESEGQYDNGKKTGTFVWWYSNGQQKTVGEYQKDREEGKWSWWHENGMREASGTFAAGVKVDQWSVWSPEGKLVKRARPSNAAAAARTATKPLELGEVK